MPELPQPFFGAIVNGVDVYPSDETEYSIESDYTVPTDGWFFKVYRDQLSKRPSLREAFMPLMPVELSIDGKTQVLGRIDSVEGDGTGALVVHGRDYLADLTQGNADPKTKFKKGDTLGDALLRVFAPFGVTSIEESGFAATRNLLTGTTPKSKPPRDFRASKLDEYKIGFGQGAFEVGNRIAARHGFTLQPAPTRGSIALAEPDYEQPVSYVLRRDDSGNVLRGKAMRDWSEVPTSVTVVSKAKGKRGAKTGEVTIPAIGPGSPNRLHEVDEVQRILKAIEVQSQEYTDLPEFAPAVAPGGYFRPLYHEDKEARNDEQVMRVAKRLLADRLRRTLLYECTVLGHVNAETGALYSVDTIAHIIDPIEQVNEPLWVISRTLRNDGRGAVTDLRLIRPHTWVL